MTTLSRMNINIGNTTLATGTMTLPCIGLMLHRIMCMRVNVSVIIYMGMHIFAWSLSKQNNYILGTVMLTLMYAIPHC